MAGPNEEDLTSGGAADLPTALNPVKVRPIWPYKSFEVIPGHLCGWISKWPGFPKGDSRHKEN